MGDDSVFSFVICFGFFLLFPMLPFSVLYPWAQKQKQVRQSKQDVEHLSSEMIWGSGKHS